MFRFYNPFSMVNNMLVSWRVYVYASTNHKTYTSLKGGWMLPKQIQAIVFNQWFPEGPKPKPSCIYWDGCWDVANHWLPKIAQKSTKKDRFSTHEEILRLLGSLVHQEKHIYIYIYIHTFERGETSFNAENQQLFCKLPYDRDKNGG